MQTVATTYHELRKNTSADRRTIRATLQQYGFSHDSAKDKNGQETYSHKDHPDLTFAVAFKEYILDAAGLKTVCDACQEADGRAHDKNPKLGSIPDWAKSSIPSDCDARVRGSSLYIASKEHPELRLRLDIGDGKKNLQQVLEREVRNYQLFVATCQKDYDELKSEHGFEISFKDNQLHLKQPDYGLSHSIPIDPLADYRDRLVNQSTLISELNTLGEAATEKWFAQQEKLSELIALGCTVAENGKATVTHPSLPYPFDIELHGGNRRLDAANERKVDAIIALVRDQTPLPDDLARSAALEAPTTLPVSPKAPAASAKPATATPTPRKVIRPRFEPMDKSKVSDSHKVSLIIDANFMKHLCMPRGDGKRNWLDLLELTAELPTVDKIYIPSFVADWELRGCMSDERGHLQQIDRHFVTKGYDKNRDFGAVNGFLQNASRVTIDDQGNQHFIRGRNPNIVIYESPLDRKARMLLRNSLATGAHESIRDRIELFREKLGGDYGEKCMSEIAYNLEKGHPAFLLSDDSNFLRMRPKHRTTKDGYAISDAILSGFIDAFSVQQAAHMATLMPIRYQTPAHSFSPKQFLEDFRAYAKIHDEHYPWHYNPTTIGEYNTAKGIVLGESLSSIFARGFAYGLHHTPEFTLPPSIHDAERIPSSEQVPLPADSVFAPTAEPTPTNTAYRDSFGYQVGHRRIEREMTEEDLATAVTQAAPNLPPIDSDMVYRWESNQELPHDTLYHALITVLVDENALISPDHKDEAKAEIRAAYERTKQVLSNPDSRAEDKEDRYAFTNTLRIYRKQINMDDEQFAAAVAEHADVRIHEPRESINAELMLSISANAHRPSFGLLRAIIKALDEKRELLEHEKIEIFDAYEKSGPGQAQRLMGQEKPKHGAQL
ncbi:MAG: hypothetical protein SFT92_01940 [Rickettsiales bacterium]|nr:hypothetical protein [Rickettsiales bacterium]